MENIVKHCRMMVEEIHALAAIWKSQYNSVVSKSRLSTLGYAVEKLFSSISPFHNSPKALEPSTLSLIVGFLEALSNLLLAIDGIEAYWGKRLYWARQFGGPLFATWEQVTAVAPAWERMSSLCYKQSHNFHCALYQLSNLESSLFD